MADWNGTTTISRDLLNRIEEVKDHNRRTNGYTWDARNNLTSITYPENLGTAVYTYDGAGNQLTATDPDGDTYTFTYDEADNLTRQSEILSKKSESDKIYSLGFTFRKIYENPGDKSKYKDGGERAVKWHQILKEALYSAMD